MDLRQFKGKILLVVNIVTQAPQSMDQLEKLERLYQDYSGDVAVLAFPSQEITPFFEVRSNEEVSMEVKAMRLSFPVFPLCTLSGDQMPPLLSWLTQSLSTRKDSRAPTVWFKTKRGQQINNNFEKVFFPSSLFLLHIFYTHIFLISKVSCRQTWQSCEKI